MDKRTETILNSIDCAVYQYRGVYADWSRRYGIGYNEMLVLYTIREYGYCTQKQVCDRYLVPRQTINNVISRLIAEGLLIHKTSHNTGREKIFVLTEKGTSYFSEFMTSMNTVEEQAVALMGNENMQLMTQLLMQYNLLLKKSIVQYIKEKTYDK
ncbi:MAG: winged helix-turn-helix transcriptional regulator [Oscillospiraceae bacterium]|nr:winged helix-turn-helix transcriptional regulator [Oscillospiraceae bacterium]MBQ5324777.1 winged helix-turn-helix transcriptional regulator [Oscillospiraceae bacterium]